MSYGHGESKRPKLLLVSCTNPPVRLAAVVSFQLLLDVDWPLHHQRPPSVAQVLASSMDEDSLADVLGSAINAAETRFRCATRIIGPPTGTRAV